MMFVKGTSEASKMGGYKFSGCAVEKKTHFCLGNVTALNLRNYLVSLSRMLPSVGEHYNYVMLLCFWDVDFTPDTCSAEFCYWGAASSDISTFTGEKTQRASVKFWASAAGFCCC